MKKKDLFESAEKLDRKHLAQVMGGIGILPVFDSLNGDNGDSLSEDNGDSVHSDNGDSEYWDNGDSDRVDNGDSRYRDN
ncbi:MAG: hypothetical protein AAFQ94_29565 [Bacteroidota bacterium]